MSIGRDNAPVMILHAKRKGLYNYSGLDKAQADNIRLNLSETASGKSVLSSYPQRIVLELTNACNLNCVMCGRTAKTFNPTYLDRDIIRWLSFSNALDTVAEVTLMGWGEPTLYPRFAALLEFLGKFRCRKYLCTNGMLLEKYAGAIVDNGVDLLAVSVNGADEATNDSLRRGSRLSSILRGIQLVLSRSQQSEPLVSFVFCIMRSNYGQLPALIQLAHDHGVKRVKAVHLTAFSADMAYETMWDRTEELSGVFEEAAHAASKYGIELELPYIQGSDPAGSEPHAFCSMPWRDMFIGADGKTRACMSGSQVITAIDAENMSFFDVWNSDEYAALRRTVNSADMPKQCSTCYQSTFCNWNLKHAYFQISEDFAHEW